MADSVSLSSDLPGGNLKHIIFFALAARRQSFSSDLAISCHGDVS